MSKTFRIDEVPLREVDTEKYRKALNGEQLDVLLHGDGPCLVLAGAGSGKTRTVTYRVAYLLERGVAPSEILLLTFTNKAAKEMTDRVTELVGTLPKGLVAGTFHSVGNRFLRMHAAKVGRQPNFTILDQEDSRDLMKLAAKDLFVEGSAKRMPSASILADAVSFSRNTGRSIQEALDMKYPAWEPFAAQAEDIARVYRDKKRLANAVDFDDLLELWLELLTAHPAVQESLSRQFKYVLVDEYQDTNTLQGQIVDKMVGPTKNLLVVGDDAQSIYAFRGATIENILSFPDRYPKAKTFRLVTNYRSTPEILRLANEVIANNTRQFPKELKAVKKPFAKPVVAPAANAEEEAAFIGSMVAALARTGVPFGQMAALFRATHHSRALEFELMRRGIAYDYRGGMKFFERRHIKDMVAFLKLVQNPRDQIAWMRILGMFAGIGPGTAGRIADRTMQLESLSHIRALSVEDLLTPKSRVGWEDASAILRDIGGETKPSAVIRAVIKGGYGDYLEEEHENWRDRLEDLEQFATFAEKATDVESFLTDMSLKEDFAAKRDKEEHADRIVLSTVHQSKGLEWDVVFVMHLTDQGFPHPRAYEEENGIEEERRLFYVAVTRARRQLLLTYPLVAGYDKLTAMQPSQFLGEIDGDAVEHITVERGSRAALGGGMSDGADDAPDADADETIELDANGDRVPAKPKKRGYLSDVTEL